MPVDKRNEEVKETPPEKKKLPVKLIIIVLGVVLVLGGAAAGYFLFLGPKMKSHEKPSAPAATEHGRSKEKGSGEGEGASATGPMKALDTFIVNLNDEQGVRYLKVVMQLELNDVAAEPEVTSKVPQIRDEIIMLLSNKTYDDVSTISGKRMLKREIITSVNKYLSTGQVVQVYFSEFVVQ
jgi:flagellar FliL protein